MFSHRGGNSHALSVLLFLFWHFLVSIGPIWGPFCGDFPLSGEHYRRECAHAGGMWPFHGGSCDTKARGSRTKTEDFRRRSRHHFVPFHSGPHDVACGGRNRALLGESGNSARPSPRGRRGDLPGYAGPRRCWRHPRSPDARRLAGQCGPTFAARRRDSHRRQLAYRRWKLSGIHPNPGVCRRRGRKIRR